MEFVAVDNGPQTTEEAMKAVDELNIKLINWLEENGGADARIIVASLSEVLLSVAVSSYGPSELQTLMNSIQEQAKRLSTQFISLGI